MQNRLTVRVLICLKKQIETNIRNMGLEVLFMKRGLDAAPCEA